MKAIAFEYLASIDVVPPCNTLEELSKIKGVPVEELLNEARDYSRLYYKGSVKLKRYDLFIYPLLQILKAKPPKKGIDKNKVIEGFNEIYKNKIKRGTK
jgi:hypothetical protein